MMSCDQAAWQTWLWSILLKKSTKVLKVEWFMGVSYERQSILIRNIDIKFTINLPFSQLKGVGLMNAAIAHDGQEDTYYFQYQSSVWTSLSEFLRRVVTWITTLLYARYQATVKAIDFSGRICSEEGKDSHIRHDFLGFEENNP